METHANHLHNAPEKKFWHYFFEFFMLFLAVTLGFFVENMREHYTERDREKQFIQTLIEDLKSDTAQLNATIQFRRRKERMVDSLAAFMRSPERDEHGNEIYYYARFLSRNMFFLPNDRTIQQLKNSGGLRLIHEMSVSNIIMTYDQQIRYMNIQYDTEREIIDHLRETEKRVFDGQVLLTMIDDINVYEIKKPSTNPKLLSTDKFDLNALVAQAQFVKSILSLNRKREQDLKETAKQVIVFLKKEYQME